MGITSLLVHLKPITRSVSLEAYRGMVVGVDAYVWLHRALLGCCYDLGMGKQNDSYLLYCQKWLDLFVKHGVTPYLVFDGRKLPSKISTETSRDKTRVENKELGFQHHQKGEYNKAEECFRKAIDVTHEIAYKLILLLRRRKLPYVVAPYEADAQLALLARKGIVSAIVTEDSDLLVFECPVVLFKLSLDGSCSEIRQTDFCKVPFLGEFIGKDPTMFRHLCILSGCDYLPSIPGIGLKTAAKLLIQYKDYFKVIKHLSEHKKYIVPQNYTREFVRADFTFRFQYAYDPISKLIVNLTPLPKEHALSSTPFLGERFSNPDLIQRLVTGELDPDSHKPVLESFSSVRLLEPGFATSTFESKSKYLETKNIPKDLDRIPTISDDIYPFSKTNNSQGELKAKVDSDTFKRQTRVVTPALSRYFPTIKRPLSPIEKVLSYKYQKVSCLTGAPHYDSTEEKQN